MREKSRACECGRRPVTYKHLGFWATQCPKCGMSTNLYSEKWQAMGAWEDGEAKYGYPAHVIMPGGTLLRLEELFEDDVK